MAECRVWDAEWVKKRVGRGDQDAGTESGPAEGFRGVEWFLCL